MLKAAAVILIIDGRILSVTTTKRGISLPCGKLEPGESPREAAIREVKEETGFTVDIKKLPPYEAFDVGGDTYVYTFLANPITATGTLLSSEEGDANFSPIHEVLTGRFWHYNQGALKHFNIPIPLTGKFHSHITIDEVSLRDAQALASLIGGKATYIYLEGETKKQTDVMITNHFVTGKRALQDEIDIYNLLLKHKMLLSSKTKVKRVKLEHEFLDPYTDRVNIEESLNRKYVEVHIKCIVDSSAHAKLIEFSKKEGWRPSTNIYAKTGQGKLVQFINKRFYKTSNPITLDRLNLETNSMTKAIMSMADIDEVKYESAIYDDNEDLDKWWITDFSKT